MEATLKPIIDPWLATLLADPISKQHVSLVNLPLENSIIDSRIFLKNTPGFSKWMSCQDKFIDLMQQDKSTKDYYIEEIEYDKPIYDHFKLNGRILDVGGGVGTVREFLQNDVEFVSVDPYINAPNDISPERKAAYSCLSRPLNFIAATAEFLPFLSNSFDWVHLRSVLDHVQLPDLVLLEASRVLKSSGRILIGLSVEGGKSGHIPIKQKIFNALTSKLQWVGIRRWKNHKDFHLWHPTFIDLTSLVNDNGLEIQEVYWQPHWNETVCYICAKKR